MDRVFILLNANHIGFDCTRGAESIRGVTMTAATVSAHIIRGVSGKVDHVAAHAGYHACTGACVLRGVAVMAAPFAAFSGYHYCKSCLWSRQSRVGESTCRGHGVNILWCWVLCNESM